MSDTIILYENGKAVGGEGHPTNADEITFNNEDTDLVSEEVESAIKEVNAKFDKGSVSVTANGVKTRAVLLGELNALIDRSKLTKNSKLIFTTPSGSYTVLAIYYESNGNLQFSSCSCDNSGYSIITANLGSSASTTGTWFRFNGTANNDSNTVDANGAKFSIEY